MIAHRITTHSEEETFLLGQEIAKEMLKEKSLVVALTGDLGAGKTTLAKGIVHGLTHIPFEEITSPTFQYASLFTSQDGSVRVSHLDLWRLTSFEEFLDLGLGELLQDGYCIIEWPDRIKEILPPKTRTIIAQFIDETQRSYSYFHSLEETLV